MRRPPVGTSAACWCERRFRHVPFQGRSWIDYIICSRVRKENRPRALSRTVSEGRLRRLPVPACQDLVSVAVHVRFTPQSGHRSARRECPLSAKSALTRCSKKDRYSIPSSARVSSVGGTSRGIRGMVRFLRRHGCSQGQALTLGGVAETFVALNRGPRVQTMEIWSRGRR